MTTPYISNETAEQFRALSTLAAEVENKLSEMVLALVQSDIPSEAKLAALKWVHRADTFRGLSYFLSPQAEWMGGDTFKTRQPHICH